MVGMGNNNNAQQQQQQQPTSSTTTTPSCILPQHNNHNDNRNRQQQQVQIGAIDIVDQLLLGINSDSSGTDKWGRVGDARSLKNAPPMGVKKPPASCVKFITPDTNKLERCSWCLLLDLD